jgi:hypothetical protein
MLVFHVDSTDVDIWENNQVNNNPNHMYYQMLRANYNNMNDSQRDPFPGSSNVTTISNMSNPGLVSWSGQMNKYSITDITEADGIITFNVIRDRTKTTIEDFEEMPVGETLNEQDVEGVFANWNFTDCAVVDTAQVDTDCGHTVAFTNGSYISTVENLTEIPQVVRYTVYNPTDANAIFYVYYSKDNGSKWLEADYPGYVSVPAGSKATATVTTLPTNVPIMLRIKQTSGSTSQPCYLDDVVMYYEGPEVPDFLLGDVNNDGQVSISDVTTLIDYLLGGDVEINMEAADVKTDGSVSIGDATTLIDMLLSNGIQE